MIRLRFATPTFALLALVGGCHDHESTVPATSPCTDSQQVSLPSCETAGGDPFSDEACVAFDDAIRANRVTVSDARSATISAPAEGAAVPRATPYTFRWSVPVARAPQRRPMTVRDELARWLTWVPEAEAHCEPFAGRAYELRFTVGSNVVYRRQQSATSWTPSTAEWNYLVGAFGTGSVTLTIYTASFANSAISAGAGPFTPMAARRFTVAP